MIFGTTKIDGRYWLVMLPLGSKKRSEIPTDQFSKMVEIAGKDRFYTEVATICEELAREDRMDDDGNCWTAFGRVTRRDNDPANWDVVRNRHRSLALGFRPVLVPLVSATGKPDDYYMESFRDGQMMELGTLYMDDKPVKNPLNPIYCVESSPSWCPPKNGDIPRYIDGAQLRIGDTSNSPYERISFVKTGSCFVADRVILGAVSYEDLSLNLQIRVYRGPKSLVAGYYEPRKDAKTIASGKGGLY